MKNSLTCVSLFSGCLGLDLGMESAGIKTAVCVEKDENCRNTIALNRPDIVLFEDVFAVTGEQLREAAGGEVDLVVGGPPCQSFSTIGKRGLTADARGKCLFEYIRLIKEIRPDYFVFENVRGILSATLNKKPLIDFILKAFKKLGYNTSHGLLDSHNYGSAQKRQRVIIIGSRVKEPVLPTAQRAHLTLRDAIIDLNEPQPAECASFSKIMAGYLDLIPPGGNWKSLPDSERNWIMRNVDLSDGGHTSFLRRLSFDRPSPTLLCSPTQRATTLCHPEFTRPLSISEYKRIQGFPDTWKLSGSVTKKYAMLGNAVPVQLSAAIAKNLVRT
jgi:DNA (cytosine-5)-methyltransferase 1